MYDWMCIDYAPAAQQLRIHESSTPTVYWLFIEYLPIVYRMYVDCTSHMFSRYWAYSNRMLNVYWTHANGTLNIEAGICRR